MLVTKLLKGFFAQKRPNLAQTWHFGHFEPGLADSFGVLLVGWLVVVARGLYLARHLFTLCYATQICKFSDEKLKIVDFWKILKLLENYEL